LLAYIYPEKNADLISSLIKPAERFRHKKGSPLDAF
jgi:hypothetical protein